MFYCSNRLQTGNAEDDYDTASDHSHEELAAPPVAEAPSDNGLTVDNTPATKNHNEAPIPSTLSLLKVEPDICSSSVDQNVTECSPSSNGIDKDGVQPQDTTSLQDPQNSIAPNLLPEASSSAALNPFTLKATTEESFGPRSRLELGDGLESKESQADIFEGDDTPVLTESSSEEESPREPPTSQASPPKTSVHVYNQTDSPFDTVYGLTLK